MRILIADDAPDRYGSFIEKLLLLGIEREEVLFRGCISDIRQILSDEEPFDLMILDLLLPMWSSDSERDSDHTIDLIRELKEDTDLQKPKHIIGITADLDARNKNIAEFENAAWALLNYDSMNSEWSDTLLNAIKYLRNSKDIGADVVEHVELAVVCALYDPELKALLALPWNWCAAEPLDTQDFYYRGSLYVGGEEVNVVAVFQPRMGMVAAATMTRKLIDRFNPRVITMTGICAGVGSEVSLGDVIFADVVWDYQAGKYSTVDGEQLFELAPDQVPGNASAASAIAVLAQDSATLHKIAGEFPTGEGLVPKLHVAPVASGSAVVADATVVADIVAQNRKVKGLEMEIYGVYRAALSGPDPVPRVYALKGVCDLANEEKNDKVQALAAYMSAQVLHIAIQKHPELMLGLTIKK